MTGRWHDGAGTTRPAPTVPPPEAADGLDVRAMADWLAGHREEIVADLLDLVGRESPSDDPGLLADLLAHLEDWVGRRLGAPEARTLHTAEGFGPVAVLDLPGHGDGRLVALCHYDTVFPAGTLEERPAALDGDRLTGPGVFDMKAGLVQCVWALRALDALGARRPPVRLVLNGDEEIGSLFSRPIIEEAAAGAAAVLVFEASVDGALKTARKGVGLFDVTVHGVESHAGLDPEAGASAVSGLAHVVAALDAGEDLNRGTSINVGVIRGGTRANVVAGHAAAGIDVRVSTRAEQDRVDELMRSLRAPDERVSVEVTGGWNRPVMERTAGVAAMYELARAVAAQMGVDLREQSVGGASDGNFVAALGLPVLDGLGAVGSGAHARHENASVTGMIERAAVAAGVVAAFG
ncbi:M20 family metallopeptidase [Georgenia alba]|uniref:M20 family metallopeptidase n=1 Tax=Georgenia alba TaxID=2233858 RepID=A0ABW2Q5M1_9MICO